MKEIKENSEERVQGGEQTKGERKRVNIEDGEKEERYVKNINKEKREK